jgi:hypothetical protein
MLDELLMRLRRATYNVDVGTLLSCHGNIYTSWNKVYEKWQAASAFGANNDVASWWFSLNYTGISLSDIGQNVFAIVFAVLCLIYVYGVYLS